MNKYYLQIACKRNYEAEAEVQKWIEAVINEPFPMEKPFADALKDGIILCQLMNVLAPGSVSKVNKNGSHFKLMENVSRYSKWLDSISKFFEKKCTYSRFQDALVEYGVDKEEIFQTNDLTERKDIANVTNTLYALGRAVSIIT